MAVILIVEDEVFIRQAAEWMIEDLGHSVLLATDLTEALRQLEDSTKIDALFVDIRLGSLVRGGYDVADQAVKIQPELRVLYTSGRTLTTEMSDLFVEGGRFVQKPYSSTQLQHSVGELLH